MKFPNILFFLFSTQVVCQGLQPDQLLENNAKKYSEKSGHIEYIISGDITGTERFDFDQYGWLSFRNQEMFAKDEPIRSTKEITRGEYIYRLDPEDSTYSVRLDKKWSSDDAPILKSETILKSIGGVYLADSMLFDKQCQVWRFENKATLKELWVWNGLVLKRREQIGDLNLIVTATNVATEIPISQNLFQLPTFYTQKK